MRFLLDTNICIYIIKRKPRSVIERFNILQPSDVGVSSLTVAELEYGACKSQKPDQNKADVTTISDSPRNPCLRSTSCSNLWNNQSQSRATRADRRLSRYADCSTGKK